jgi:hypothetical protein
LKLSPNFPQIVQYS